MKRQLTSVLTTREYNYKYPSFHTVFEWENIIAQGLNLKLVYDKEWYHKFYRKLESCNLSRLYKRVKIKSNKLRLLFVMTASTKDICQLDKNTIPVIIDFWLCDEDLPLFYKAYSNCPLVLITSAEVYEFLVERKCPLPIEHWPLSLPDNIEVKAAEKKYDFCFIGRKDPFFIDMIARYSLEHPEFEYIINSDDINNREYRTNKGKFISKDTGRESYLNIIRQSKICVYSTPGIDSSKNIKGRFNQVTPRVLELISGGCYVLGHYPDNCDTQYYKLHSVVPQIKNYEEFAYYMNLYRSMKPRDINECKNYIYKHNTTSRIKMLTEILYRRNWK